MRRWNFRDLRASWVRLGGLLARSWPFIWFAANCIVPLGLRRLWRPFLLSVSRPHCARSLQATWWSGRRPIPRDFHTHRRNGPSVLLTHLRAPRKLAEMASFAQFLGRKVTVQYRVGDVLLPASGTLAADSGRSIFLEQHVEQRGKQSYFRWEIPYQFIHRIEELEDSVEQLAPPAPMSSVTENPQAAAAGAGHSSPSVVPLIGFPQRPKTVV